MAELVENSFALSTHLLKKDLHKARRKEPVEGYLNFLHNGKPSVLDYFTEYEGEDAYLVVSFNIEPQKILLSEHELSFGTRTYLTCKCGLRTNALYFNKGIFACRKCHKLRYKSVTINRNSRHGKFLYQQISVLKLMAMRESMGRILYKSQYSKRFKRWLKLCARAGLTKETLDAQNLMAAINSQ